MDVGNAVQCWLYDERFLNNKGGSPRPPPPTLSCKNGIQNPRVSWTSLGTVHYLSEGWGDEGMGEKMGGLEILATAKRGVS